MNSAVEVALIGAVALVVTTVIPLVLVRGQREMKARLGVPNGGGDVVTMLGRAIEGQGAMREMTSQVLAGQGVVRSEIAGIAAVQLEHSLADSARFAALYGHLGIPFDGGKL